MERHRADTIEDFTDLLVRSGLSTQDQVPALLERFQQHLKVANGLDNITAFCTFLVADGTLTAWQCEKLRKGQWKGFFDIDGFVLLDNLGPDANFAYYLARDTSDGTLVHLKMTPRVRWKGPDIEYCVDHRFG